MKNPLDEHALDSAYRAIQAPDRLSSHCQGLTNCDAHCRYTSPNKMMSMLMTLLIAPFEHPTACLVIARVSQTVMHTVGSLRPDTRLQIKRRRSQHVHPADCQDMLVLSSAVASRYCD
jgi:hypothetical protein